MIVPLVPLAGVLRPFGLPYELAFPLLVIIDPVIIVIRIMLNVAANCTIPALAARAEVLSARQAIAEG